MRAKGRTTIPLRDLWLAGQIRLRSASLRLANSGQGEGAKPEAGDGDRGDVPGWVLVTLMTAGLVVGLWSVAGDRLEEVFSEAMDMVLRNG